MKTKKELKPKQKGIILNKMYSGDYLAKGNLGHEIINLYKSDNGENYIYIMSDGEYNLNYDIECVLLARVINRSYFEILGKATGLEQIYAKEDQEEYINNITYAEVPLKEIFASDDDQGVYITFKAKKVVRPKETMFVRFAQGASDKIPFKIEIKYGQKTKQYVLAKRDKQSHEVLCGIINDGNLWGEEVDKVNSGKKSNATPQTIFDICGITHYELAHSKAIGNLLLLHRGFAEKFVKEVLGIEEGLEGEYTVKMETEHRIDIFITDEKKCIIIENKIKSGINGVAVNEQTGVITTQLDNYYKAVTDAEQARADALSENGQNPVSPRVINGYLLSPDYNRVKFTHKNYEEKFYSKLYDVMVDYLKNNSDDFLNEEDRINFKIITDSFKRHTFKCDNTLFEEMEKLFSERLSTLK